MVLGSTQPLTEMSTRNLPGGKGRPARKGDNLTTIYERLSRKCCSLDVSQPYGPSWPVTGNAFLYITKLRGQRAEVIQNNEHEKFATLDKAKPDTENIILGDS
jgi:hypothetical protein